MTVKINFPGGVWIEADTLVEAVAVAKAFAPNIMDEVKTKPAPAKKRTRVLVTNGDLETLGEWGLFDDLIRDAMSPLDWTELATALGRSVDATKSVVNRYSWGVYERSGSDPAARAIVHADKDRSRPGYEA